MRSIGSPVIGCWERGWSRIDCSTSMYSGVLLWFKIRYLKMGIYLKDIGFKQSSFSSEETQNQWIRYL